MLEMLDYDLKGRHHKELVEAITILKGGGLHSADLNVRFAPWFLVSDEDPVRLRNQMLATRYALTKDALLILPLGTETAGLSWHFNPSVRRWLTQHGVTSDRGDGPRERVVGLSYTLHRGAREDYRRLIRSIEEAFPDSFEPLHAMWFLHTDESLRRVVQLFAGMVPLYNWEQHQALALEIPTEIRGAHWGLTSNAVDWFKAHGIHLN